MESATIEATNPATGDTVQTYPLLQKEDLDEKLN